MPRSAFSKCNRCQKDSTSTCDDDVRTVTQTCVGNGNQCVISESGVYRLCGDVTFSVGVAIRITASCVTLDLAGFTLDGGGTGCIGVLVDGAVSNVTIRNGLIKDLDTENSRCAATIEAAVNAGVTFQNGPVSVVLVEDVSVESCLRGVVTIFDDAGSTDFTFRRCRIRNTTGRGFIMGHIDNLLMDQCVVDRPTDEGILLGGTISGKLMPLNNVTLRNCAVNGTELNNGVWLQNSSNVLVSDCTSSNNGVGIGFISAGIGDGEFNDNVVFERCCAMGNNSAGFRADWTRHYKAVDCVATGNTSPIFGQGYLSFNCEDVLWERCSAQGNANAGFSVFATKGVTMRQCLSLENGLRGIVVAGDVSDVKIERSVANGNGVEGILTSGPRVVVGECTTNDNGVFGILNSNADTDASFFGNRAFFNGTSDYVNVDNTVELADATTAWQNVFEAPAAPMMAVTAAAKSTVVKADCAPRRPDPPMVPSV